MKWCSFKPSLCTSLRLNGAQQAQGDNAMKLIVNLAPAKHRKTLQKLEMRDHKQSTKTKQVGVIGSDVPWLDCPSSNAMTWVITVTE